MRSNGLSQKGLAKKVGIHQSTISDVLNGNRKLTKGQVIKLASFFNLSAVSAIMTASKINLANIDLTIKVQQHEELERRMTELERRLDARKAGNPIRR
jgi:plasmid maintenance system antidote protein VapI